MAETTARARYLKAQRDAAKAREALKAAKEEAKAAAALVAANPEVKGFREDAANVALAELVACAPFLLTTTTAAAAKRMSVPDGALVIPAAKPANAREAERRIARAIAALVAQD
jgi:hypothetical protein